MSTLDDGELCLERRMDAGPTTYRNGTAAAAGG